MKPETFLDELSHRIIRNRFLQLFTVFTRVLLAVGFIPPSITKILNIPFTVLPDSHPVGHYFNALYQTGFYYQFIGWGQLIAALFLLIPRTAHLGALIFLPIILNISVLTASVNFAGTKYITGLMLLACMYLVCWEYPRLKSIFFHESEIEPRFSKSEFLFVPSLFAVGGILSGIFFVALGVGNLHKTNIALLLFFQAAAGFVFGLICVLQHKFMKIGDLE